MKYIDQLQLLGLSESSARIYLALLETKHQTISELSKITGLYRPSVYAAMSSLLDKGVVTKILKGKRWVYFALPTEALQNLIKDHQSKQESLLQVLSDKYEKLGNRPIISYFEGVSGIERAYEALLVGAKKGDIIYRYESPVDHQKNAKFYPKLYWQLATRHGTDNQSLLQKFVITNENTLKKRSPRIERYDKAIPVSYDPFNYDITQIIFKDKVVFIDYENKVATLIHSQRFAIFQRQIFKFIFQKLD